MSRLQFQLLAECPDTHARAGSFQTLHNPVHTPVFMPVGTHANVRGQRFETLNELDYPVLLANTYHLMLRPGVEVFERLGGIQRFMNWPKSVLTDSGGFQIFSLPNNRVMSEEGALFRSYVNEQPVLLTPEKSIAVQKSIGSDIMMVLDQCIPSTAAHAEAEAAMQLTHRWAKRSLEARGDSPQSMFAIVQGAVFPDLRHESAATLTEMPFDGFAIGGLAVGESKAQREDIAELTAQLLPRHLPRYLMGVGTPLDLLEAVHRGVDMFDCILPGALGDQGVVFTDRGKVDLRRGAYKFVDERLTESCECTACRNHSIAYLHHLVRAKQSLAGILLTEHNLRYYAKLMREIRASILGHRFKAFYDETKAAISGNDRNFPVTPRGPKISARPKQLGDYELHETRPEVFSIRHIPSGEVMHSVNDPTEEAHTLYVEQSRFAERVAKCTEEPLVVWDVGLGAGINAMAALATYETSGAIRPVTLVSFENDLSSLKLALQNKGSFAHLWHAAPHALIEQRQWACKANRFQWTLIEGDFLANISGAPAPHLIFFDPFSSKTDTSAWTVDAFQALFACCKDEATELFTYSASTAVRAALLAAGFFVARGVATGPKMETTVAMTPKAAGQSTHHAILPVDWLSRWERSHAKFPPSLNVESHAHFETVIRSHPQFAPA